MTPLETYTIQPVHDLSQVQEFLLQARLAMFAQRVDAAEFPADLRDFKRMYGSGNGRMLMAQDAAGKVRATIACRDYDGRFEHLRFSPQKVVEVVRLFVAPELRRSGLGSVMVDEIRQHAQVCDVDVLYLHTHPFLPGALEFWQAHGFDVIARDVDPLWQTIHMQRALAA